MRDFAHLLDRLFLTASRNAKLVLVRDYLAVTPDPERGYALAAMTGDLVFRAAKPAMIREAVAQRVDARLFALSYDFVGDLAETAALVWPARPGANAPPTLASVVEELEGADRKTAAARMETWLDALDADGRWALLKLITGGLRVGLSVRLARQAVLMLAVPEAGPVVLGDLEELWHGLAPPYPDLFAWLEAFVAAHTGTRLDLSPLQPFDDPAHLAALRADPPEGDARLAEGLMLKRWDSPYLAGRPKGPWFKWKRAPFLVDAVMQLFGLHLRGLAGGGPDPRGQGLFRLHRCRAEAAGPLCAGEHGGDLRPRAPGAGGAGSRGGAGDRLRGAAAVAAAPVGAGHALSPYPPPAPGQAAEGGGRHRGAGAVVVRRGPAGLGSRS